MYLRYLYLWCDCFCAGALIQEPFPASLIWAGEDHGDVSKGTAAFGNSYPVMGLNEKQQVYFILNNHHSKALSEESLTVWVALPMNRYRSIVIYWLLFQHISLNCFQNKCTFLDHSSKLAYYSPMKIRPCISHIDDEALKCFTENIFRKQSCEVLWRSYERFTNVKIVFDWCPFLNFYLLHWIETCSPDVAVIRNKI